MKPVDSRFPDGELTITIGELKEWLSQFPDETPVVGGWEGQIKPIVLASSWFEIINDLDGGKLNAEYGEPDPVVVLDVDN